MNLLYGGFVQLTRLFFGPLAKSDVESLLPSLKMGKCRSNMGNQSDQPSLSLSSERNLIPSDEVIASELLWAADELRYDLSLSSFYLSDAVNTVSLRPAIYPCI
jgi:hypothetical protein